MKVTSTRVIMPLDNNPRLFGITHSNRNFRLADTWGKNQFNSSFPAALVAYLYSKKLRCVYIKTDVNNRTYHDSICPSDLFGIDPTNENAFYAFESVYTQYTPFYIGNTPRIDLVIQDRATGHCLKGLEVKLTALPDNSTCDFTSDKYSCELVIRPDTISYLACSIAKDYVNNRYILKDILGDFDNIDWDDEANVLANFSQFVTAIDRLIKHHHFIQEPLVVQPVWKTNGKIPSLANNCLDVFVWSNLALIHLFTDFTLQPIRRIGRTERTLVWLVKMLWDFTLVGQFNADDIIDQLSFNTKNDKAFSVNGRITYPLLACDELTTPRIQKNEIKNIILGGGQNLLSPERRFDAIIFNSPDLFI